MSRRLVASVLTAASLLPWMPVSRADAPPDLPRAACEQRVNDGPNDAPINFGNDSTGQLPPNGASVPALDISDVNLRLTDTQFQIYLHINKAATPAAMPATDGEYVYTVTTTANGHSLSFSYFEFNANKPWDTSPFKNVEGSAVRDGTTSFQADQYAMDLQLDTNFVVWTLNRAALEKQLGGDPLVDGDQFTAIKAVTQQRDSVTTHAADSTTVTGDAATYTVGVDYCFGAPPAEFGDVTIPSTVQYTDAAKIVATLGNEDAEPLPGKTIELTVAGEPGMPKRATTDANGDATFAFTPAQGAGTYAVTLLYPGDATDGKAKATGTITVTKESTKFGSLTYTKSGTARYVTATLLDNDNHPVVGQKVDWYVNGKKVATLTTDSKGRTTFKGAKAGQTVFAKYAGLTNKFVAATSKSVKLS